MRAKILNLANSDLREFFVNMFAESDAYPDRYGPEMLRESLLVLLKRQFEKLISENKELVEEAGKLGSTEKLMELVKENTELKDTWEIIQKNVREWGCGREQTTST